ncbi:MAG TPA: cyclic nucleotide-binding domain-containing protein [Acidimicrobiia bacterium]|nr:cyclic nucleotide-binding domain-containing protein [Acidimicrobiia bacterium]
MPSRRRGELGKVFGDGEVIVQQGDVGEQMFVVQSGKVEVVLESNGLQRRVSVLESRDFFGEMALFDKELRSATVRALGEARVLTIDKRTLLKRISEDPLLAYNLLRAMSSRVRDLNDQVSARRDDSS